jgi:hypothetical protein
MEGFDRLVDKHYDKFHDGVGKGFHGARRHIHIPSRGRKNNDAKPEPDQQRSSSEPRIDRNGSAPDVSQPRDFSDDEDQGYVSDYPRRRSRRETNARENEPAYAPNRKVRINPVKEVWASIVKPMLPCHDSRHSLN